MSFQSPLLLALLAVPALALAGYVLAQRRPARHGIRYPNLLVLAEVAGRAPRWRRHLPAGLVLAALVALVVALARPVSAETVAERGATVVLVADTSGSMRAMDVKPSRIDAARAAMLRFLDRVPRGLRVGVVAFSAEPVVITPPTTNRDLARQGIELLTPGFRTAIGDALARAVELARSTTQDAGGGGLPTAAIVLLSDGAQTSGLLSPDEGAQQAREAQVRVNTVALGTPDGFVDSRSFGRGGGFGPDPGGGLGPGGGGLGRGDLGRRIPVPPDAETLARIAAETGGTAFTAQNAGRLNSIYERLGSSVTRVDRRRELTFALVAAGAVLLLGAGALAAALAPRLP